MNEDARPTRAGLEPAQGTAGATAGGWLHLDRRMTGHWLWERLEWRALWVEMLMAADEQGNVNLTELPGRQLVSRGVWRDLLRRLVEEGAISDVRTTRRRGGSTQTACITKFYKYQVLAVSAAPEKTFYNQVQDADNAPAEPSKKPSNQPSNGDASDDLGRHLSLTRGYPAALLADIELSRGTFPALVQLRALGKLSPVAFRQLLEQIGEWRERYWDEDVDRALKAAALEASGKGNPLAYLRRIIEDGPRRADPVRDRVLSGSDLLGRSRLDGGR